MRMTGQQGVIMCDWCKKDTKMIPQECGGTTPMVCEHCGGKVADLDYKELRLWRLGKLKLSDLEDK